MVKEGRQVMNIAEEYAYDVESYLEDEPAEMRANRDEVERYIFDYIGDHLLYDDDIWEILKRYIRPSELLDEVYEQFIDEVFSIVDIDSIVDDAEYQLELENEGDEE